MRPPELKKQQLVPASRTKINQKGRDFQGITQSFEISFKSSRDALIQLQNTRLAISTLFGTILKNTKGSNFVATLKIHTYIHTLLRLPATGLFIHNVNYYIIQVIKKRKENLFTVVQLSSKYIQNYSKYIQDYFV